jgi:hypothetical protein
MSKKGLKGSNEILNFYESKAVKKLLPKVIDNPTFLQTQISVPARIGVIAPSGTGKTIWILNYIARSSGTFGHTILVHKQDETLYDHLRNSIGSKHITMYKKLTDLPSPDNLGMGDKAVLLILDDIVVDKKQEILENYFIRGRKIGLGITIAYLSQSYYDIPKIIRKNMNYLIILKLSGERELTMILRNYSLGLEPKALLDIYKDAVKTQFNFLKISISAPENKKFSKNWTDFYKISNDSDSDDEK